MNCPTCTYARAHGWWGPDHRGTHCGNCHFSWTSRKEAHCSVCHEHFASVTAAEEHWCDGRRRHQHTPWCDGKHARPWAPRHAHPSEVCALEAGENGWRIQRLAEPPRSRRSTAAKPEDGEPATTTHIGRFRAASGTSRGLGAA